MSETEIQKFYKGSNVFITGGTGFLGKILIEKLLRSTEVNTLYLLIREKKGKNAHARIDELFDDEVQIISGDCATAGLGVSIKDRQTLISNVNILFNVAATVKFDENLKTAYAINVASAKEVIEMAKQMSNLKSIIHVSTAFCNCPLSEIDEKFYDFPHSHEDIKRLLEKLSFEEADKITPRVLGKWPNTYTFTKALTESMLKEIAGGLPFGIFRPAIVISTYREPVPGWINNLYGPTGIVAATMSGVLRVMSVDIDCKADMVPVDTCVAGLLASAWDTENITIYNYVSSAQNPLTWREFAAINTLYGKKYCSGRYFWVPSLCFITSPFWYALVKLLLHIIPASIIDALLFVTGNKPRALDIYRRIHKMCAILQYFGTRSWNFSNKNMANVWQKMSEEDRLLFNFNIKDVHWMNFYHYYTRGVRKYLLKESEDDVEKAQRRDERFTLFKDVLKYLMIFAIISTILNVLSTFPNLRQTNRQEDDVSTYVQHLNALYSDFESRFEDILTMAIPSWIVNSNGDIEETNVIILAELTELSTNKELKVQFKNGYQQFWMQNNIPVTYPVLWNIARKFFISFPSSHLVERGFSAITNLLTKKRNIMDIISRGDLRLTLTKLTPNVDNLLLKHQVHPSH
nr:unnamed protein product [Callosobruchus analis]